MKSEWMVGSNIINSKQIYTIYRRDRNETGQLCGNREKVPIEVYDALREVLDALEMPGKQFLEAFANLLNVIHDYTEG